MEGSKSVKKRVAYSNSKTEFAIDIDIIHSHDDDTEKALLQFGEVIVPVVRKVPIQSEVSHQDERVQAALDGATNRHIEQVSNEFVGSLERATKNVSIIEPGKAVSKKLKDPIKIRRVPSQAELILEAMEVLDA
eukprot:CAMPEP_0204838772 /NCGR_PEP_ID=MMETSP1346-20131115/31861_1 /ASSEMBLY_ACC=CAM_ASM_000771 /TAXON_ID=215587 /ORGANISM="Aplanochytrium stocchinoi, Strain GSBS06" /LENGTH=133 /DNA_ID=CAMNT_0051975009 /DNA_START=92 /DNA_END=490 /DNA_ORIENTATION=-